VMTVRLSWISSDSCHFCGSRRGHLRHDTLLAAAAIYKELHGKEDGSIGATFQIMHMVLSFHPWYRARSLTQGTFRLDGNLLTLSRNRRLEALERSRLEILLIPLLLLDRCLCYETLLHCVFARHWIDAERENERKEMQCNTVQ
jgi:hypothetical protein